MARIFYTAETGRGLTEKVYQVLRALGGMERFVRSGDKVLIKPNFVAPFPHATTRLEVVEALVEEVRRCQGHPVVAESSGFEFDTRKTLEVLGVNEFCRVRDVPLVNLDESDFVTVRLNSGLVGEVRVARLAYESDVLLNVPKLKRHSLTGVTIAVKNLFALLDRASRRKMHAVGLERAIFEVTQQIGSNLVIVDGSTITGRAVYGERSELGLVVGGTDPHAIDRFCCRFLDVDWRQVGHLRLGETEAGIPDNSYLPVNLGPRQEVPPRAHLTPQRNSVGKWFHRSAYQMLYMLDMGCSGFLGNDSLIPQMHYRFGIHPKLIRHRCTDCGDCARACPANAIQIPRCRIDTDACARLRCLKCVEVCPAKAIEVRGRDVAGYCHGVASNQPDSRPGGTAMESRIGRLLGTDRKRSE